MKPAALTIAMLACALTATAANKKTDKKHQPPASALDQYVAEAYQHAQAAPGQSAGSIWTPEARLASLGMDLRSSHVDDLVTIVIFEQASAVASGDLKTQRTSSANASVTALAGIPKATATLPNLLKTSKDVQLQGQGTTGRHSTLTTTLSARVTNVLPNGYLVVEGTKNITVNSENQLVTVRGVIRPIDLDTTNAIRSDHLAQLEVRINGKGVVGDAVRRPFFLYRLLLGLLPF